ncbi:MAG: hypothetical protein IT163_03480 [Bryobacterales bacterium]|nr:hypothetical protein [Bryobacterales bacterium]
MESVKAVRGKGPEYGFEPGLCLPDLEYVTTLGVQRRLSDFKDRKNLVIILAGNEGEDLLASLAAADEEVRSNEGHLIAILPRPLPAAAQWPFDVVVDPAGTVRRKLSSGAGETRLALFVTDRWGEVVFTCKASRGDTAPTVAVLLDWLRFVDQQCPECFPPEWPVLR